jgi:N-carbamoyl-L-amino-acid hydrolase
LIEVDPKRLGADFEALSAIGATAGGGVSRTTFSDAHFAARAWFLERVAAAGLETRIDAAGNHSAVLPGLVGDRVLLLGSHLDSVPNGGRFDGALGVLAALEVLRTVRESGARLPITLEAIDFTDEEATLVGLLGSYALTGELTADRLRAPRGGRDALLDGLDRAGLTEAGLSGARRDRAALAGSRSWRIAFEGESGHAGTTPMQARRDAALGAAAFVLAVRETVTRDFPDCVATVGDIDLEPGAFNVIPGRARLSLELRSPGAARLELLESALLDAADRAARGAGLGLQTDAVGQFAPVAMHESMRLTIARAAHDLGLRSVELVSGAGHDAQALARVTPTGMIFVPSAGGVSHDPAEYTEWQACVNGANVLLRSALLVAESTR